MRGSLWGRGRLPPPLTRTAYLSRLAWRPLLVFGGGSVLLLALARDLRAVAVFPPVLASTRREVIDRLGEGDIWVELAPAWIAGVVLSALLARVQMRRGWDRWFGDTRSVMPMHARELPWSVAMALSAGVSEELFFRLAVPLLAARATGSAWGGLMLGVLLFGLAHRYQGWRGVIVTGAVGAFLALVYLQSGSLLLAIGVHVLIDLNALVLRPVVAGRVHWR